MRSKQRHQQRQQPALPSESLTFFPRRWLGNPAIRSLKWEMRGVLLEFHAMSFPTRQLSRDRAILARQFGVTQAIVKKWLVALHQFYTEVDEVRLELHPLDAFDYEAPEPPAPDDVTET